MSPTSSQSYRSCSSPPETCDRAPGSPSKQKVYFRFLPLPPFLSSGLGCGPGGALGPGYLRVPLSRASHPVLFPARRVAHSITSSARARSVGGMVRLIDLGGVEVDDQLELGRLAGPASQPDECPSRCDRRTWPSETKARDSPHCKTSAPLSSHRPSRRWSGFVLWRLGR